MIEGIIQLISIGGGLAGYTSVAYLLWRKLKRRVQIFDATGVYELQNIRDAPSKNLITTVEVTFFNDSESEKVSITDIVGALRYDKTKYKANLELIAKFSDGRPYIVEKPVDHKELPITLHPKESIRLSLRFSFSNVFPEFLERVGLARFKGFIDGLPLYEISEIENIKYREHLPILMQITAHIDGRKLVKGYATLFEKGGLFKPEEYEGTLSVHEINKIGLEFTEKV
ncbi:MAG: hypothetical protein H0Z19_09230 [Archaeoglobus sp.]|uniref:hypothetical protein n=1 Tax=Archaeoglobus sp. TaxID=1872626 RepID=UPI001D9BD164|nr:hypothetical protein [Archaeoglobus sp.]MBO8180639.1 hypothetical protein [Archaeoglobus sp.]